MLTQTPQVNAAQVNDILTLIQQLAQNQTSFQNAISTIVGNTNTSKGVGKPQNYDGKQSDDAHCFLAAFELWAQGIPSFSDEEKLIKSAISFLEGEAAIWATPISENISQVKAGTQGVTLLYPAWSNFKDAFKARFETTDAAMDSKEALKLTLMRTYETAFMSIWLIVSKMGWSTQQMTLTLQDLIEEAICIDNRQVTWALEKG
ncbi:hypothetical protein BT96DRAFT_1040613 [Gymnopus androsaceus JB14]|uniref:Retrotransposon gag domain-containing protein n=1 Tax=Gymnopus androsaceus JB14 TaxID=1447944 RepID=A0A6A4HEJ0_9AGAR|nr:hypothetical protein BT96DRAFT_1040613 [Gymnopus androsaceus JB14]